MSIRYTLPMALPALYFLEPGYILIGLSISPIYGLCWTLKNKGYINVSATQVAEVFSGFVSDIFGIFQTRKQNIIFKLDF